MPAPPAYLFRRFAPILPSIGTGAAVAIAAPFLRSEFVRPGFERLGLMLPNATSVALAVLALAVFAAARMMRISNAPALLLALLATAYYYIPPTAGSWYDSESCRMVVLAMIAAGPFVYAIRSLRVDNEADHECGYLPTLDGWRAIAVTVVLLDHLQGSGAVTGRALSFFLYRGQHGVNLFFGISGFLITWKLLCEYRDTGRISLAAFYRRRIFRILPAAFLFLAVAFIVFPGLSQYELASCVMFYRNMTQGMRTTFVTAHFWSLSVEEQFYLCLPVLFVVISPRRVRLVAVAAALACSAWRWVYLPADPAKLDLGLACRTDLRIDGLLCGCLLAFAFHDDRLRNWLSRATSGPRWWAALAAYGGVIAIYAKHTTLFESVLVAVIIGGTVLHPGGVVGRMLESRPFRMIGRMSYGIYLWQQLFCFVPRLHLRPAWLGTFPFNIIATLMIATLSFYAFERPILRASRRRRHLPTNVNAETELSPRAEQFQYAGT